MSETNAISRRSRAHTDETTSPEVERTAKAIERAVVPLALFHGKADDEHAAEAARNMLVPRAPFVIGDLSLYTPDALEREIDAARARLASASQQRPGQAPGPRAGSAAGEAEQRLIDRAEAELARRAEPAMKNLFAYRTSAEVDVAIAAEKKFLARFGRCVAHDVSAKHERHLAALEDRRDILSFTEHPCDRAQPIFVDTLPHGAAGQAVTADDLVGALKTSGPLTRAEEAHVRSAFEAWRQRTCLETGTDPTSFVNRSEYHEAKIDTSARAREETQKFLEVIGAMRGSPLAAGAFLDSAVRGESLDAAVDRVRAATIMGRAASAAAAAPLAASSSRRTATASPLDPGVGQHTVKAPEIEAPALGLIDDRLMLRQ